MIGALIATAAKARCCQILLGALRMHEANPVFLKSRVLLLGAVVRLAARQPLDLGRFVVVGHDLKFLFLLFYFYDLEICDTY